MLFGEAGLARRLPAAAVLTPESDMYRVTIKRARQPYGLMIASWKYEKRKDHKAMRVPIFYMSSPGKQFWLTDDHTASPSGDPVLIDATGRIYYSAEVRGLIFVTARTCSFAFYDATRRAGYRLEWSE
ncbi:MAG: hypothetical protein HYZ50_03120 [Deltaproteobacteria bacterium]|nr:hypothetical protein [Deltaproteobacteria bacterium]